jgi:sulfate permease, SulP family
MTTPAKGWRARLPVLQGFLPVIPSQVPTNAIAGATLAALAIPEVMGYTRIAGTPVVTGLYTLLLPMALFALFGSSRHLVVGADSATAAILAGGLTGAGGTELARVAGARRVSGAARGRSGYDRSPRAPSLTFAVDGHEQRF